MDLEKSIPLDYRQEQGPKIVIRKSTEAPFEVKENPFYDPEFWGRAYSSDDIYLPDSDEAISFAMAAHEIGHLIKEGERLDATLDNFEATRAEEQRAWDKGWEYLKRYLEEYYGDDVKTISQIQQVYENIKNLLMEIVDLSKDMYLEKGALDNLSDKEQENILKERREKFSSEKGDEIKKVFQKIKDEKIGKKPDWNKFVEVITKAVKDILKDNKIYEQ